MSQRLELVGVVARGRVGRRGRSVGPRSSCSGRCRTGFRCQWGVGPGARRRRGAVGGSLRSAGWTTGIGTGTRAGFGCEPRTGVPPATTCRAIGLTTTRPGFHPCVRQSYPSSTRSIASDLGRQGLQSCSTSIRSIGWYHRPHVRRLRSKSGDRVARNGSNRRRGQRRSPGLPRFSRPDPGGSDAPRRRDGLAVATARASGDSRCRLLWEFDAGCRGVWRPDQSVRLPKTTKSPRAGAPRGLRQ